METEKNSSKEEIKTITLKEFLEKIPPGKYYRIKEIPKEEIYYKSIRYIFNLPELVLYCDGENCKREMNYTIRYSNFTIDDKEGYNLDYAKYTCKNCEQRVKIFSLVALLKGDKSEAEFCKIGELPPFGPPTPSKLIELIGPDKEYFLLGRRCENQGLGIGAFTYYRRVVENQKNRIFDRIIDVANKVSIKNEVIQELELAKKEIQFKTGIEKVKHALPESLLIDGHNPLTLLHKALSEGVHDKSDEECLELASSIRVILGELSQRAALVLKEDVEVKSALSKLMNRKKKT